jgi:RNA polymerase sigma-70 factor (ECF subfamily)
LRMLRSHSSAEDVLQDVFLQIWRFPDPFLSAHSNLAAWLTVVTRNKTIDVLRKRPPEDSMEFFDTPSAFDLSREAELTLMGEKARLISSQLPPEQLEALNMAFWSGLTHSEISELIGVPIGTVKTRIRTALLYLKKHLYEDRDLQPIDIGLPATRRHQVASLPLRKTVKATSTARHDPPS